MTDNRPTVLSLFSGVGGFDIGLESAGMRTVYQCEIDKHCRSVLDRHWPHVPKWSDISTLIGDEILSHAPEIDVVAWGSPCQDLSVAGARAGLDGQKSSLFHEGIRVISEIRKATDGKYPRISIWENVYGALSSNKGADFRVILAEMAQAGSIFSEWRVLDAQFFGIPQRRRRVFVISVFDTAVAERCIDPILPITESVRRHTATRKSQGQASARETTDGTRTHGKTPVVIDRASYNTGQNAQFALHISDSSVTPALVAQGPHAVFTESKDSDIPLIFENSYRDSARISADGITNTLSAQMGTGGLKTPMVVTPEPIAYSIREDAKANNFSATEITTARALQATQASVQSHHAQTFIAGDSIVRKLTPLECERLMGWSDDHTRYRADGSEQADTNRYKQIGNGVASPVAQWIGEQIVMHL